MPYRKCSFCSNNNKVKKEANYFKLSKHILQSLGLPDNYGDHICSDHFVPSDISNGKLLPTSVPTFLHRKSCSEHDHGYQSAQPLAGKNLFAIL